MSKAISDMTEVERKAYWASVRSGEVKVGCRNPVMHENDFGAPCDKCTAEIIDMMAVHPDEGPWTVEVWAETPEKTPKVVIASDDFRHDVALIVTGDFWDIDQKKAYAQLLADKLNRRDVTLS